MISRNNKLCNSAFVLQRFENKNEAELKISLMIPDNQTLQREWEQLSQLQRKKKKKKKEKEQKDGTQADGYPQTARAELKDNTSVSRSYITSYHSPNFTQTSQDWKHGWTKHFAMADITSSCCQRTRSVQPAALRLL